MVEFGLVFPMVMACFCGIVFFGSYLFSTNRMDHALRESARQVMMLEEPTLGEVRGAVKSVMDAANLTSTKSNVAIEVRDDDTRVAVIEMKLTMTKYTSYFDTSAFVHASTMRAPLFDR